MTVDPRLAALSREIDMGVLGERLRTARVAAGLRQSQLAEGIASKTYISRIESGQRRPDLAILVKFAERCETTLEDLLVGSGATSERAELRLALDHAELALRSGNPHDALEQLLALGDRLADSSLADLAAEARYLRGLALEGTGDVNGAVLALEDVVAEGAAHPRYLRAAIALTRCYREAGDLVRSVAAGEAALQRLDELDLDHGDEGVQLSVTVAAAYFERGDIQHAVRLCRRAIERAETLDSPVAKASAYWNASIMESEQGQVNAAIPLARHALMLLESADDNRNLARLHSQLGMFLLKADPPDAPAAVVELETAGRELSWSGASAAEKANNSVSLARAVLMTGDPDRALELLEEVREAGEFTPMLTADLELLTGQIRGAQGRTEEARAAYQAAVATLTSLGADRRAAQLWFELGALLQQVGEADLASDAYRRAAASTGLTLPATSQVPQH